jgi:hypothetical protein
MQKKHIKIHINTLQYCMPDVKVYLKVQNCLEYIHMKGFLNNDKTCDFFPMQITLHVKQAKIKKNIFVLLRLQNVLQFLH